MYYDHQVNIRISIKYFKFLLSLSRIMMQINILYHNVADSQNYIVCCAGIVRQHSIDSAAVVKYLLATHPLHQVTEYRKRILKVFTYTSILLK